MEQCVYCEGRRTAVPSENIGLCEMHFSLWLAYCMRPDGQVPVRAYIAAHRIERASA